MDNLPTTVKLRIALIALLIMPLAFAISWDLKAQAMEKAVSGSSTCVNDGVHPSPYTGGAGISRVFYPGDGSTVTVTTTGAVIKQSPCGTPYREGWVNTADLNCVNSEADLSVRLKSGSTNPYHNFATSCPSTPAMTSSSSVTAARPASNITVTSSTSTTAPARPVAAVTTANGNSKAAVLPNTGPGDFLAVGGISTILGTIGHYIFRVRRYR